MRDALCEALAVAEGDPGVARVQLDGAGPCFSAGGDLDEFGTHADPSTSHVVRSARNAGRQLSHLAERLGPALEARVHGACVGAGVELPAFCGRVVARPDAWFQLPEVSMGLVPGAGGTASLPRRIGRQRTAWLALSGARLAAETALDWGLVDALDDPAPGASPV
jgi:enoyl-CoA hydratase/carnithine racemase